MGGTGQLDQVTKPFVFSLVILQMKFDFLALVCDV